MRKFSVLLLAAATLSLGACASVFGGGKGSNLDEFAVARNAPLVIPPDFSLVPPAPGTISTTAQDAQSQAVQALFGGPAPRSAGEMSVLEKAGTDRVALGARSVVGDPATTVVDKGAVTQTIIAAPESDSQVATTQPQ